MPKPITRPIPIALSERRPTADDGDAHGLVLTYWPRGSRDPGAGTWSVMSVRWLASEAGEAAYLAAVDGIPTRAPGALPTHWSPLPAEPAP